MLPYHHILPFCITLLTQMEQETQGRRPLGEIPVIAEGLFSFETGGSERVGADVALECARRGYRVVCFAFYGSEGPIRRELEANGVVCADLNYLMRALSNALVEFAGDPELRRRFSETAFKKVAATNDLHRVVDQYLELFALPSRWPREIPQPRDDAAAN